MMSRYFKVQFCLGLFVLSAAISIGATKISSEENGVNRLVIHTDQGRNTIAPEIYGHFAEHLGRCIYEGFWVGEDSSIPNVRGIRKDVVAALKKLNIGALRWPGGCFADEYHWKEGIGPRDKRPATINTHWGMVTETNAFGTHEFLDLCEQLGCEPCIAGNVGSGTVEEMADWVEYMTFDGDSEMANLRRANGRDKPWRVKYFGVGNENWGCGGNMTPEYYADLYKRFQTYVRNYSGNRIVKIACGPGGVDYNWMDVVMRLAARRMNAVSLHYYVRGTGNWTQQSLGPRERVITTRLGPGAGVVVTQRRALGISTETGGFFETKLRLKEEIESVQALSSIATITTSQRTLIFKGPLGLWVEHDRPLR